MKEPPLKRSRKTKTGTLTIHKIEKQYVDEETKMNGYGSPNEKEKSETPSPTHSLRKTAVAKTSVEIR